MPSWFSSAAFTWFTGLFCWIPLFEFLLTTCSMVDFRSCHTGPAADGTASDPSSMSVFVLQACWNFPCHLGFQAASRVRSSIASTLMYLNFITKYRKIIFKKKTALRTIQDTINSTKRIYSKNWFLIGRFPMFPDLRRIYSESKPHFLRQRLMLSTASLCNHRFDPLRPKHVFPIPP